MLLSPDARAVGAVAANHSYLGIGRLKPGITYRLHKQIRRIAGQLEKQYPETNTGRGTLSIQFWQIRSACMQLRYGP